MKLDIILLNLAASLLDSEVLVLLSIAILGLFLLVLAALIYVRESGGNKNLHSSASSVSIEKLKFNQAPEEQIVAKSGTTKEMDLEHPSSSIADTKKLTFDSSKIASDEDTAEPVDHRLLVLQLEKDGRFEEAANGCKRMGLLHDEIRVLKNLEPSERLGALYRALGNIQEELATYTQLVSNDPKNWKFRAHLIGLLLQTKQTEKAINLFETALEERTSLGIEYDFFVKVGRLFENARLPDVALKSYKNAATAEETNTALHARMNYLKHLVRLKGIKKTESPQLRTSDVYRIALQSSADGLDTDFDVSSDEVPVAGESTTTEPTSVQMGWIILVGHPAFGKTVSKDNISSLRINNPITRMEFESTLSERETTVLFQTRDRLIDFPVTLRLQRLFLQDDQFVILSERLKALNRFFHPNITKLIYADSVDSVVRVVTEYHQGGSFYAMIKQLKQIGLPLGIRLLLQISSGIVYSHKHGVIHGDLRAENIMIGHDQLVKIVDYSLQPWPVLKQDDESGLPLEEVRVDLLQFADLVEFTIGFCNVTAFDDDAPDPKARLYKLVERIRENQFDSMASIQNELSKQLDDIIPHG